jgi:hypothetical protein
MARQPWPLLVAGVLVGLAGACATKTDPGQYGRSGDAGAEAGALDAAPRLPGAAPVTPVSRVHDAAARDSQPMCPVATTARVREGGTTTPVDIKNPVVNGVDAGAPPEDCLAPCVWELVRQCPPPAACTDQDYGGDALGSEHLSCGENDWWDSGSAWHPFNHQDAIYVDGRLCYRVNSGAPGSSFGSSLITWADATQGVAVMVGNVSNDDGQAFCGVGGKPVTFPCVSDQDCASKGIVTYDVYGTAEKCAPWRRIIDAAFGQFGCKKGCCPTDPPVLPSLP